MFAGRPWTLSARLSAAPTAPTQSVAFGRTIVFAIGGDGQRYLGASWSFPEEHGTWSIAREAAVRMGIDGRLPAELALDLLVVPFVTPRRRRLDVDVNGRMMARWAFLGESWRWNQRVCPPLVTPTSGWSSADRTPRSPSARTPVTGHSGYPSIRSGSQGQRPTEPARRPDRTEHHVRPGHDQLQPTLDAQPSRPLTIIPIKQPRIEWSHTGGRQGRKKPPPDGEAFRRRLTSHWHGLDPGTRTSTTSLDQSGSTHMHCKLRRWRHSAAAPSLLAIICRAPACWQIL